MVHKVVPNRCITHVSSPEGHQNPVIAIRMSWHTAGITEADSWQSPPPWRWPNRLLAPNVPTLPVGPATLTVEGNASPHVGTWRSGKCRKSRTMTCVRGQVYNARPVSTAPGAPLALTPKGCKPDLERWHSDARCHGVTFRAPVVRCVPACVESWLARPSTAQIGAVSARRLRLQPHCGKGGRGSAKDQGDSHRA